MNNSLFIYSPLAVAAPVAETAEASTGVAAEPHPPRSEMDVSDTMVLLTWASFLTAAFFLHRLAWKPIMAALDKRENAIKKSLQDLKMTQMQIEALQIRQKEIIAEADRKAQEIVAQSRLAAQAVSDTIEARAKEEAKALVDEAQHDIHAARDRVIRELHEESAGLAIDLAGKLVRKNLDDAANRQLTRQLIDEL